jgi:hypothetical protein
MSWRALVITRSVEFLDEPEIGRRLALNVAAVVLERREVAGPIQESLFVGQTLQQDLAERLVHGRQRFPVHCPPQVKALQGRDDRADPGLDAIGDNQRLGKTRRAATV